MFSICIPNYNYEKYLGLTLDSIFDQRCTEFEVIIADNCSTDGSVSLIHQYAEKHTDKLKYKVNPSNLGFSANLDQAAGLATQPYIMILSSDDRMNENALFIYKTIIDLLGRDRKIILCAANDIIDPAGNVFKRPRAKDFRFNVWQEKDIDRELSEKVGEPIYRVRPNELLHRSLSHCTNPFNFCATCYSKSLYDGVSGYGGGRMINPDKWYHWRIIAQADEIVFVDAPLFQYRWHPANQTAQQANSGFLKYLVDEYRNVIEMPATMLTQANLTQKDFIKAFLMYDIFRHGMGEFSKGRWLKSLRIYFFGWSVLPSGMVFHGYAFLYALLLLTTPIGSFLVSKVRSFSYAKSNL